MSAIDDREQLAAFLTDLRDFVYRLFDVYEKVFGPTGELGRQTWDGVEPNHEALTALLRGRSIERWPGPGPSPVYEPGAFEQELEQRGLTGVALRFKLAGFYQARAEWDEHQARPVAPHRPGFGRRVFNGILGLPAPSAPVRKGLAIAKRGLKWADVGLITLASFVQVGEPIKEAKKGAEALVEDALDLSDAQLEQAEKRTRELASGQSPAPA